MMDMIALIQFVFALLLVLMVGGLSLTVYQADFAFRKQYQEQKKRLK